MSRQLAERIALNGSIATLIGGLFLTGALVTVAAGMATFGWAFAFMAAGVLITGASTVYARAQRRQAAHRRLERLDLTVTFASLACYSGMAAFLPPEMNPTDTLLLISCMALVGRAVFVPSSARRTFLLGLSVGAPVLASAAVSAQAESDAVGCAVSSVLWFASILGLSTAVSRVTWDLRGRAERAELLGQYRLEELIAEGGMGRVYRARHALLRRPTAVKVLPEPSGRARQRFEREVRLTARLTHPNTVTVFDYGRTDDGLFYYAMELVEGHGLDEVVQCTGPMSATRTTRILEQVASALVEAHELGLIHRDIKPSNVMLTRLGGMDDVVKVLDFGLVKDTRPQAEALSHSDIITGTPLYISPEAIRAAPTVDARADLYALGALGYYLLTGTHVFDGNNAIEICGHHLHTPPSPPSDRLGKPVPDELEDLLLTCLEKDPDDRPRDARTVLRALGAIDVGRRWTAEDAAEWWRRHHDSLGASRPATPIATSTMNSREPAPWAPEPNNGSDGVRGAA